jgi:uncharacterized membrane protein YgdD (TMEM256/DUF423 family)
MRDRRILLAGALLAATGIACGAFGAHALHDAIGPNRRGWWQTAVQYQMWHAVALVALASLPLPRLGWPAALLALGTIIFAGTLYVMALTDLRWLGAITPLGGLLMIAAWLLIAWRALGGPAGKAAAAKIG